MDESINEYGRHDDPSIAAPTVGSRPRDGNAALGGNVNA